MTLAQALVLVVVVAVVALIVGLRIGLSAGAKATVETIMRYYHYDTATGTLIPTKGPIPSEGKDDEESQDG